MKSTRRAILRGAAAPFLVAPFAAGRRAGAAEPTPVASPTPSPTPSPAAEALARAARERYGKFLTEEEQKLLDERIAGLERRSGRLRTFKLQNGEEPVTDFRAVRR
ncbi:MAG: hypothetical protein ACRD1B_05170 [Thermoanaerobaculia bacterium]